MIARNLQRKGMRLLGSFPVLVVLGARQAGKSTFVRQLAPDWLYLDIENPTDAERVLDNPELFLPTTQSASSSMRFRHAPKFSIF